MKMADIIKEIRRRKDGPKDRDGLWQKQEFASAVKMNKSLLSGRMDVRWEEHWEVIQRIMDLCDELGIDPREPVNQPRRSAQEVEDFLVLLLKRCLRAEKPRPRRELIHILERAVKRAAREEQDCIQDVSTQGAHPSGEDTPGGLSTHHGRGPGARRSHRG